MEKTSITRPLILFSFIVGISLLHYLTPLHLHYLHDIFQRFYYLPIILAAFNRGLAGGIVSAVVVCGSGHIEYGLGTAARVRRRMPGVKDRIVHFSESGDVELSPQELAMARPITITHEQLRELGRPIADYLHAVSVKPGQ